VVQYRTGSTRVSTLTGYVDSSSSTSSTCSTGETALKMQEGTYYTFPDSFSSYEPGVVSNRGSSCLVGALPWDELPEFGSRGEEVLH
jgi:hypothetical protein